MQPGKGTERELSAKMLTCSITDYSFPQAVGFSGLLVPSYGFPYYSNSYMMPLYTLVEDEPSVPLWDGGRAQGQRDKSWIAVTHSQSICLSLTHTCLSVTHTHTHTHTSAAARGQELGCCCPLPVCLSVTHTHTDTCLSHSHSHLHTHTHTPLPRRLQAPGYASPPPHPAPVPAPHTHSHELLATPPPGTFCHRLLPSLHPIPRGTEGCSL